MPIVRSTAGALAALLIGTSAASAAFIPNALTGVTGIAFHQGDSGVANADGNIAHVFNRAGLTVTDTGNPATWTHDSSWQRGW